MKLDKSVGLFLCIELFILEIRNLLQILAYCRSRLIHPWIIVFGEAEQYKVLSAHLKL
jgi:hypothetical protein